MRETSKQNAIQDVNKAMMILFKIVQKTSSGTSNEAQYGTVSINVTKIIQINQFQSVR